VRQLEALFDVPAQLGAKLEWHGELPIEKMKWNVGLIVGPSGCGKTQILRKLFPGHDTPMEWSGKAVVDNFENGTMQEIAETCSSVGFNTIPAWMRSYGVLSNGEKFRVEMARRLLRDNPIVMDEFTSVVDRQVAQIGAHAVQKKVRKMDRQFVAASCHYDIVDWLQPDWILEPATMRFVARGSLQGRPSLDVSIQRVGYEAWELFAPFHYLTANLHKAARCFGLYVRDRIASFAGCLHRPHATATNITGLSRLVTLPDWQGLGLAMILAEKLGAANKAIGKRFHTYPAHPSLVRSFVRDTVNWRLDKKAGTYSPRAGKSSTISSHAGVGGRPCAVFEYVGAGMDAEAAEKLLKAA
jgi:ABC-type lipoprotein export system ATPase subunit/GNAT superfamily N-acetyltransferase